MSRLALLLILLLARSACAQALDDLVASPQLWQTPQGGFVEERRPLGFYWLSQAQDRAESHSAGLTLFGQRVYETDVEFEAGKVSQVVVSIYNRGDAGDLTYPQFQDLLGRCVAQLSALTHARPAVQGKQAASAVKADAILWQSAISKFLLEYSFTREVKTRNIPFRAEFMRLKITPVVKSQGLLGDALAAHKPAEKFNGPAHVKKLASGDVLLDTVPMVDQGQKGYCVVASAERVMRYYGVQADENELAELANTSATQGTSTDAMMASLKKLTQRLHVRVSTVQQMDIHQFLAMIADYNRAARRKRLQEIPPSGPVLDMPAIYAAMNADLFREVRTRNKSDVGRMMRQVQDRIDQGVPLLWSVMLGIVPEKNAPQGLGGHMRLIIGYNAGTNEILYSDSWGPGHELKRMPAPDAWAITTHLDAIEPF